MPVIMTDTPVEPVSAAGPLPETVVIVGASGFIGRNLVRHLSGKVGRILPVSASGREVEGLAGWRIDDLDHAGIGGDTVVINLAAHRYDGGNFAGGQPEIFLRNVEITTRIYEFCARSGITELRVTGSMAVYPADDRVCDDAEPVDLNREPHQGELMYAWSKRIGEVTAGLFAHQCGIHTATFRLTNPYGPYDSLDEATAHVVPAFIIRALTSEGPFAVRGDPAASRDFIYVGDVCEVFARSLAWRGRDAAYNLGSGENTTIDELARTILRLTDSERELTAAPASPGAVLHRRVRNDRLRADLPIERFTKLRDGLLATIEWYRDAIRTRT
jgi:nucleoside-diphosphate-sugar epimerase